MDELISRQAALRTDCFGDGHDGLRAFHMYEDYLKMRKYLESLPSAQPEPDTRLYSDGFDDGYKQAIKDAQPEWIPCSERLPEESGEYLCTLVGVHNTGLPSECGYEPPNNHGITPGWSTCEADGFKFLRDDEVLAWMPLPKPYAERLEE